jgi:ketosteroid isomerase-like protein
MRSLLAGSLVLAAVVACQPAPPSGLSDADRAAIDSTEKEFVRLALAGDFAGLARGYYPDDGTVMPPNAPAATGHAAIEAFFRTLPPLTAFELRTEELEGTGDLAYKRGRYTMTMAIPGGPALVDSGKYLEVLKKQSDGSWKTLRDMFSSDLPVPAADTTKRGS